MQRIPWPFHSANCQLSTANWQYDRNQPVHGLFPRWVCIALMGISGHAQTGSAELGWTRKSISRSWYDAETGSMSALTSSAGLLPESLHQKMLDFSRQDSSALSNPLRTADFVPIQHFPSSLHRGKLFEFQPNQMMTWQRASASLHPPRCSPASKASPQSS